MKLMITSISRKCQEAHRHYHHTSSAKCSICLATVLTAGESQPDSEIAGIDEKTGILICRHCVETYMSESRMTA
ncbi:MAG TPA: hypothetical protein DET40_23490 [Lentisphaeria bacterium]|nr:MAG: hypothetical protein A2X45_23705 [Lentisphaerae bacterium GWF2_50_93]HCE46520.1 hypothetical protein [Lentisphaeria bacterium]